MRYFVSFIFLIVLGATSVLQAANSRSYTILYTGKDGNSYFKEAEEPLIPAKVGLVTRLLPTKSLFFGEAGGAAQDWHNPAQRLFIIVLSGVMQIETSSGQIKAFKAGDILLAEDLTGKGHRTSNLNEQPVNYLAILLAD
ncbi:hypothetical protein BN59_01434 [Legionella massiliensis]|uniref:Cupin domain protein n=1 Tax=Legionella massiliensis TaxID=1034943 RepID=A0A078KVW8_9GAMM|nr:hypothetical protein [Legionella massiliensis]CDZ77152.1 hypothetical protein BN59_01434 [Legionella massiliensis]CEE12890.1 hypothetical protein BN1094_01434 [Legionella massiliensis]